MSDQLSQGGHVIPLRTGDDDRAVLFISHRHEDKPIADTLRKFIQSRTGGQVTVYQSSSPDAEGPKQGQNLRQELRRALWLTSVLVLIYTTPEEDWSYCMWECGVAQLPEPLETRPIVLQCSDKFPSVFAEQLHVGLRKQDDIERFVTELLTDPTYFPKLGRAVTEFKPGTEPVKEAAAELYSNLQAVLPEDRSSDQEWPPYPQLTIELTNEQMERIKDAQGPAEEKLALTRKVLVEEGVVVGGDSQVGTVFHVNGFPRKPPMNGIPLRRLVESWQESTPTPTSRWLDDLAGQIRATVNDDFPVSRWQLMRGADRENSTWYGAVVRYFKRIPARRCAQIDVTFCKFRLGEDKQPQIQLCEVDADE